MVVLSEDHLEAIKWIRAHFSGQVGTIDAGWLVQRVDDLEGALTGIIEASSWNIALAHQHAEDVLKHKRFRTSYPESRIP
jgi:hypothetical protein